jgi:hypothetical protein
MINQDKNQIPADVQVDLNEIKQAFMNEELVEAVDPNYNRMIETLEKAIKQTEENQQEGNNYQFDHAEFVATLEHIVSDQLSAIKREVLQLSQVGERFNRWVTFCNAVVNLGISCVYSKESLKDEKYEDVFKTLKLNKIFETTFLKPRGIKIELRHKSEKVMEKYSWLAMPVLVIKDEKDEEHLIALTPSPGAEVWWLDILSGFHASYNWNYNVEEVDPEVEPVVTSIGDPLAPIKVRQHTVFQPLSPIDDPLYDWRLDPQLNGGLAPEEVDLAGGVEAIGDVEGNHYADIGDEHLLDEGDQEAPEFPDPDSDPNSDD